MEIFRRIAERFQGEETQQPEPVAASHVLQVYKTYIETGDHSILAITPDGETLTVPLYEVVQMGEPFSPIDNHVPQNVPPESVFAGVSRFVKKAFTELWLPVMDTGFIPNIKMKLYAIVDTIFSIMPFSDQKGNPVISEPQHFEVDLDHQHAVPIPA